MPQSVWPRAMDRRASGILLHPTSLPGSRGIGTIGWPARQFVDFLAEGRQTFWQLLPLGPTGFGDSPYSSFCSAAGNPLLIDLDVLIEEGDLTAEEAASAPASNPDRVEYQALIGWKLPLLRTAAKRFLKRQDAQRHKEFEAFRASHAEWLADYALFMALKEHFERGEAEGAAGGNWDTAWDKDIALREPAAVWRWSERLAAEIKVHEVWQFYFFRQWTALRQYAHQKGIRIIGDMPFYIAADGADVWVWRELFQVDKRGNAIYVAGVPPDYFSITGQRWGNPLYDWEAMQKTGFAWWKLRFRSLLELVDVIRIDHFRGFEACWAIPAAEATAEHGQWLKSPGEQLFRTLLSELGEMPIIAEDLGLITHEVERLRDEFGFPGMRVLQIGFEEIKADNIHLPERHIEHCVVYTGTHDNNTTAGWYASLTPQKRAAIDRHLGRPLEDPAGEFVHMAMQSRARAAVIPLQDLLGLGAEARMNIPATTLGNWAWRARPEYFADQHATRLAELTKSSGRAAP